MTLIGEELFKLKRGQAHWVFTWDMCRSSEAETSRKTIDPGMSIFPERRDPVGFVGCRFVCCRRLIQIVAVIALQAIFHQARHRQR